MKTVSNQDAKLEKIQAIANMENPGHVTRLIRIEEHALQRVLIPDCSSVSSLEEGYGSAEDMSTSPDTSCRSSADADKSFDLDEEFREKLTKFENIIEKIENLHFARDEDDDNEENDENRTCHVSSEKNVDNVEYRDTCKSRANRQADNEDVNNNEDSNDTFDDKDEQYLPFNIRDVEERRRHYLDDRNSSNDDSEAEEERRDEQKHEDSDLIERGPIKPDFQPLRAGHHPYSMVSCLSRANDSVDVAHVDYDKTAEQILRNKDYSEKLNPCLDQLSNSNCRNNQSSSIGAIVAGLAMDSGWSGDNGDNIFHSGDPTGDTAALPSIIVNESGEESLMDILSRNGFQAAILSDAGSHSIPSPRSAKTWSSDSPASSYNYNVVSRSNSRASSRAQSPGSATNLESPQMHVNVIGSPLGSPQVASTYRVPQALLSSSSSSSNRSYSDVSSPLNYQTPLNYQLEDQLDETLSDWNTYDSSGTIVNSSDTIELLQLVEQVIEEDNQRKESLKEPQVASNAPCFSLGYNDRICVVPPVRGTLENNLERGCRDVRKSEKSICFNASHSINNPMSVYTSKQNTSGGTLVNCTPVNGQATSSLQQRYYEPNVKNDQVNVSTCHNTLHNIAALNDNEKMPEQNASREKYEMIRANISNGEKRYNQASSIFVTNDYQIPTMVFSSFIPNRPQRNSNRGILPWPSLNLPSVRASERLKEGLHPKEVERAMSNLLKEPVEKLAAADEDGDTKHIWHPWSRDWATYRAPCRW